jgi:peptidoglycan/xylan/chitin deacetylase (PgdA/CDA1 family)
LFIFSILALLLYAPIPTVLARLCGLGAICRLPGGKRVFLTFDDGPDPQYTPQVLNMLEKAGVKACFFVVGEKARQYPGLVRKILAGGHEIGSHGFSHRNPWLLGPLGTMREIENSFRAIREVTGFCPRVFRPPWGLFTLSHAVAGLLLGYKTVLWSFMSWDWSGGSTPDIIAAKVCRKMADGSILVFHDSDTAPGAAAGSPGNMLNALPGILEEIKKRGYRTAPLKEITHSQQLFYRLLLLPWQAWDYLFRLVLGVKDVAGEDGRPTIFRVSAGRYHGPGAALTCGSLLRPGARVCEIHLNNEFVRKILGGETGAGAAGVKIAGELKRSLPALARHLSRDPRFTGADYLTGITLLHRGAAAIGFQKLDIPSPALRRVISAYQGLILKLYHPAGGGRLCGKGGLEPKILVMSKKTLEAKYLKAGLS